MKVLKCFRPLPDGSKCHACRLYDTMIDAETAIEPKAVAAGYINIERCLDALGDVAAHFAAEMEDDEAMRFFGKVFALSRTYRDEHADADPLAHTEGNA
jgi:hypothetical protein